jgi:hypothetical protein
MRTFVKSHSICAIAQIESSLRAFSERIGIKQVKMRHIRLTIIDAMHRNFVQLAACGLSVMALVSLITATPQHSAQGLETPSAPQGAQRVRRIIVELSAPPLSVVYSSVVGAPAPQRELALRIGQIRIALEQALFIAQVTDVRIGAVVTGRAQMTVNSVSLSVSAEKIPLISALRGVKAVHPDPTVERGRP